MAISSDSYELAIKLEREGYDYYKENSQKADNPFVVSVLDKLAQRELEHIEAIEQIAKGKPVSGVSLKQINLEEETREIFEEFSQSEQSGWKDEKASVYEHALELEKKLANLYADMAEESQDEDEIQFFEALVKEEDKHYETLQNVFYYLTDHDRWMAESEGQIWGWMNT